MVVGILELDLRIHNCQSLKMKRGILRQMIHKIKTTFDVAVAEVGEQNLWQRARIGVAVIGNDRGVVNQRLDHVLNFVDRLGAADIVNHRMELINL